MKAELIINHTAGGGKPEKYISEILSYFDRLNFEYHVSWTPSSGSATALARQAAEQGADLIISVGGDGTINEIINGIIQSSTQPALGIIPAGWANDFIKSTSIPRDILQACQIISRKKTRMIDVGLINEETYFAN
ncbi:MAG TPA: acylglycerol kinase family protein, partial [Atribacterota bacterium]|nr:acylglycerol kinase family protein [Atribacterota bacterium]